MAQDRNNQLPVSALQVTLPVDEGAELNVLGTIISHDELFTEVEDVLTSDVFRREDNRSLFRILKYIIKAGNVIDENSIIACAEKFRDKIGVTVDEIRMVVMEAGVCDSPRTFYQDVERLVEYSMRRKAWETLQRMSTKVVTLTDNADETISDTMKKLDEIRNIAANDDGVIDARKAVQLVYDQINDNLQGVNKSCIKTGFRFSDAKGGLRLGSLVVIGAWTSTGKTSLALNIATNVAMSGVPVAYYSLEMGAVELWSRIVSGSTDISAGKILNYPLKREEVSAIDKTIGSLANIPLYIDDKATSSFRKVMRSLRTMVKKYKIKMFVLDYIQIFAQNSKGGNDESILSSMARECKNICKELDLCGIVLSQLRRDKENRHPTIDMLRGSGGLEESADNVVLIDRPEAHPEWGVHSFYNNNSESIEGKAELRVCKGRNIGLGTYYVGFDAQRTQFYELDGYRIGDEIGYDDGNGTPFSRTERDDADGNVPF